MEEDLLNVYKEEMKYPMQILEIFNEFFGEERVDMQGFPSYQDLLSHSPKIDKQLIRRAIPSYGDILVHFPHVTVTNENDRSTEVNHLYAKIQITKDGKLNNRFTLNRSEYSYLHMVNNYMHSHMSSIPFNNFSRFDTPCTGTGPINHTMASLFGKYDEDLWRLFCLELDKFVQVESITGTPYHRLESLTLRTRYTYSDITYVSMEQRFPVPVTFIPLFAEFTKHIIDKNILRFVYAGNSYCIGMSPLETIVAMSNCFIEWYNRDYARGIRTTSLNDLLSQNILFNCKYKDGRLLKKLGAGSSNFDNYLRYEGEHVCFFKGQEVTIHIVDLPTMTDEENTVKILNTSIIGYIITKILNIINIKYGNARDKNSDSSAPNQEVRII